MPARGREAGLGRRPLHPPENVRYGQTRYAARSATWLKPRIRCRPGCNGTGTTQSVSLSTAWPCDRIRVASGGASERRPSYLKA